MLLETMYVISYSQLNLNWSYRLETLKSETKRRYFNPGDLEIRRMT